MRTCNEQPPTGIEPAGSTSACVSVLQGARRYASVSDERIIRWLLK